MNVQKEVAACLPEQAAGKNYLHRKAYPNSDSQSRLKFEIGEILFCLQFPIGQPLSRIGWVIFERRLRQYVDLIHTGRLL